MAVAAALCAVITPAYPVSAIRNPQSEIALNNQQSSF